MARSSLEMNFQVRNKRFRSAEKGLRFFAEEMGVPFKKLSRVAQKELRDMLDTVADAMQQRHSDSFQHTSVPGPKGVRTGRLFRRTGGFIRDLKASVLVTGSGIEATGMIGGPPVSKFMVIHETGGTIRPKRAKFLTVPLQAALSFRGVPLKRRARDWPNTFVATSRRGNLLIFQRRGGRIIPLYALKKSVRIPARLGLGATLRKAAPVFIDRVFDRLVKEVKKVA